MTLKEAKQLKIGDRLLVEAEVVPSLTARVTARFDDNSLDEHIISQGNVSVKVAMRGARAAFWSVAPEAIREKIAPPPRKFRKGDIVMFKETFHHVIENEHEGVVAVAECGAEASMRIIYYKARPSDLKLVCPVEERHDRNAGEPAAGEPGSVSRRRGNLGTAEIGGENG